MKTLLAIVGALAIFVVGVFAILFVIGVNSLKPMTAEATAYADESILAIASDWDGVALADRASPELRAKLTADTVTTLMAFGQQHLGALTNLDGATCEIVNFEYTTENGEQVTATCSARAEHELGAAGYALNLIRRNDDWSVLGFFVVPDELREPNTARMVGAFSALTVSVEKQSIGLSTGAYAPIGADIRGFEKIENLP